MDHYEFHNKFTDKYGMGLMIAIARMDLSNEHIAIYGKWADEVGKPTSDLDKMFGRGETATRKLSRGLPYRSIPSCPKGILYSVDQRKCSSTLQRIVHRRQQNRNL